MVFSILASLSAWAGLFSPSKKGALYFLLIFILVFPSPFFAEKIFTYSSVSYLDFLFAGLGLSLLIKKVKISKANTVTLAVVFAIFLVGLINTYDVNSALAKDVRFFLYLMVALVCLERLLKHAVSIDFYVLRRLLVLNALVDGCIFLYLLNYGIPEWASTDLFYVADGIFEARYIDFGTILCLILLIKFAADKVASPISILACLLSISVSGNRTIIFVAVLVAAYWLYRSTTKNKSMFLIGGAAFLAIIPFVEFIVSSRAHTLSSLSAVLDSLYNRYLPAIVTMDFDSVTFVFFGNGLGLEFFIPWFTFRSTEPYAAAVDGLAPTLFAKMGLLSIPLLLCYLKYIKDNTVDKVAATLFIMVFLMLSVTMSPFYQNTYVLYLLAPVILNLTISKK